MQRLAVILLGMCLGICCGATAQRAPAPPVSVPVFHLNSSLVLLDAIVADHKSGRMVTTLTPEDFALEEDGVPQKIRYFSQDKLPLSIVFLFDLTQSVQPELKEIAAGALGVLDHLKPEDEVAIMTFSSSAQMLQPFTKDRRIAAKAIQRAALMKSGEATFIDEVVYEGAKAVLQAGIPDSRRVLVFFTDGTSNYVNKLTKKMAGKGAPAYLHNRAEAREELLRNNITVSALIDRSPAENLIIASVVANPLSYATGTGARLNDVEHFAAETGGPVLHGHGRKVAADLAALIQEIRGRYTMGYVPSTARPAGTFCHVALKLTPQAYADHPELKHGHYEVRARAGYYR